MIDAALIEGRLGGYGAYLSHYEEVSFGKGSEIYRALRKHAIEIHSLLRTKCAAAMMQGQSSKYLLPLLSTSKAYKKPMFRP